MNARRILLLMDICTGLVLAALLIACALEYAAVFARFG